VTRDTLIAVSQGNICYNSVQHEGRGWVGVRVGVTVKLLGNPVYGRELKQQLRQYTIHITTQIKQLRWSIGSVPAFGNQVRGFRPSRSRRIFQGEKKSALRLPFGGELKAVLSHVADLRLVKEP
jgi:hypothetical protein